MRRRELLSWVGAGAGLALAGGVTGCGSCGPMGAPPPLDDRADPGTRASWRELDVPAAREWTEPGRVLVRGAGDAPALVALHGAGEHARGLVAGSRGFRDDYALDVCARRLHAPPLSSTDFQGFVRPERLRELNDSLATTPFEGLGLVCPFTPRLRDRDGALRWAAWLESSLLPLARKEGGLAARSKLGIDGVSMGGRLALLVGLGRPDLFDSVGALQPALGVEEAGSFAELAARAHAVRPRPLRLVSSDGDPFLEAVSAFAAELARRGIPHQLVVTPGPHDYAWNRGPGCLEMLLWHDRVLRGRPAV